MPYAQKKNVPVEAWMLGAGSGMEEKMIGEGKIIRHPDGTYELFSQECTGEKGETALPGDYFKVDDSGSPYPNSRAFFLNNHRHHGGDLYLQESRPLKIWRRGDPMTEEIRFLLEQGKLQLHPEDPEHFFSAFLWGAQETAPDDAIVVFFSVTLNPGGEIEDIDFNFVRRGYFDEHYVLLPD